MTLTPSREHDSMRLANVLANIRFRIADLLVVTLAVSGAMAVYRSLEDWEVAFVGGMTAVVAVGVARQAWDFSRLAWGQRIATPEGLAV